MKRSQIRSKKPRRNDGPWRRDVLALRGEWCRSCGDSADLQIDHVQERSQGGASDVENGLVLCGPWSRVTPAGCHVRKTEGRMLIEFDWLDPDQVEYLAAVGWVWWDADGVPNGPGCRGFANRRVEA